MLATWHDRLTELPASSFAMVMATGIVSIGAWLLGVGVVDVALAVVSAVAYLLLSVLVALRLTRDPGGVLAELTDHRRGAGFLAIVAATCVVGTAALVIAHSVIVATTLLVFGAALWLVLMYAVLTALTIGSVTPSGVDGNWLLLVVGTEAIAVLAAALAPHWHAALRADAEFAAVSLCLLGGALYAWLAALILYRCVFVRVAPADLTPTYWISMGATAISALAGALLVQHAAAVPLLSSLRPFLDGFTILCWATGTWWIPLLVILTFWRHGVHGVPVGYDARNWAAVFPLGMYAVATIEMARALSLGFLAAVGHVFFWISLAAWALTFGGLLRQIVSPRTSAPPRGSVAGRRTT